MGNSPKKPVAKAAAKQEVVDDTKGVVDKVKGFISDYKNPLLFLGGVLIVVALSLCTPVKSTVSRWFDTTSVPVVPAPVVTEEMKDLAVANKLEADFQHAAIVAEEARDAFLSAERAVEEAADALDTVAE